MIDDYLERHYPFEGCFNFRDIGGYHNQDGQKVKKGLYFRAGRQDRMTDKDLAQLSELNISTQIDLRKQEEVLDQGRGPLEAMGANYINIAVIPEGGSDKLNKLVGDTGISGKRYLGYLEFGPTSWLRLFGILAEQENLPVLLHCTAGKDRTGVSTAFLLSVLGVSRDPEGYDREKMITIAGVPQDAMKDFLDGVESKWGSVVEYLQKIGITQDQMNKIRDNFLE